MLKAHTILPSTIALIGAAVILLIFIALGAAIYHMAAPPALSVPVPAANPVVENPIQVPVSVNPIAARSVYVSEQSLRRMLDDAYEKHQTTRVQTLLHILNGRYERRCCGFPY
jgi:hypothetical protein